MSNIDPIAFKSKSGKSGIISSAKTEDAQAILSMSRGEMAEDIYTLTTPDELSATPEQEASGLKKWPPSLQVLCLSQL